MLWSPMSHWSNELHNFLKVGNANQFFSNINFIEQHTERCRDCSPFTTPLHPRASESSGNTLKSQALLTQT